MGVFCFGSNALLASEILYFVTDLRNVQDFVLELVISKFLLFLIYSIESLLIQNKRHIE